MLYINNRLNNRDLLDCYLKLKIYGHNPNRARTGRIGKNMKCMIIIRLLSKFKIWS